MAYVEDLEVFNYLTLGGSHEDEKTAGQSEDGQKYIPPR